MIAWLIAKATCSITVTPDSVSVEKGSSTTATCSSRSDGTISVVSSSSLVANASIDGSTITIEGIDKGECTVTVTQAEGTNYTTANATIAVTVSGTTPSVSGGGVTIKGQAIEDALQTGETAQLTATKLGQDSEGFKKAYEEFMSTGNYKELKVYDIELTAVNSTTGASRTITELNDNVTMTIDLESSAYNGNSVDIQEYHTSTSGSLVTIPYTGLKVADGTISLEVKNFSQFNVLFAKDSVDPGSSDDDTATTGSSAQTGDASPFAALAVLTIFAIGATIATKQKLN